MPTNTFKFFFCIFECFSVGKYSNYEKEVAFSFNDCNLKEAPETDFNHPSRSALSGKVLILNQSYEPVSVCSIKKAIILLFLMKADLVAQKEGRHIRSVKCAYPYPSVIRLTAYVRIPYKRIELSRKNILRRDGNRCQYCGKKAPDLTIDHIVPKSRGGTDSWENLVAACVRCNNRKGNRTPEEARISLLKKPSRPHHILFFRQFLGKMDKDWRPFLFMD